MVDGFDNAEFDNFVRQKLQDPVGKTLGRSSQTQSDYMHLLLVIEFFCHWLSIALLAVESNFKPFCDKTLTDVFDRFCSAPEGFGNF